jgi:hypothetical protein
MTGEQTQMAARFHGIFRFLISQGKEEKSSTFFCDPS